LRYAIQLGRKRKDVTLHVRAKRLRNRSSGFTDDGMFKGLV